MWGWLIYTRQVWGVGATGLPDDWMILTRYDGVVVSPPTPMLGTVLALGRSGVVALVWGAVAWGQVAEQYDLRPHWVAGQSAVYEFWTRRDQTVTISAPGVQSRDLATVLETTGELTWTVNTARLDGSYACTMLLDWIVINITSPDGTIQSNDSRKPQGDIDRFQDLLKAISGVPLKVEVAADGSITHLSGTDKMRQVMEFPEDLPENLDWIESATDLATLPGVPGDLGIGRGWKNTFRWTHDNLDVPDLEVHTQQHHNLILTSVEQIEGIPVATVDGSGTVKLDVDRSKLPPNMPPLTIRLVEGQVVTQVLFDMDRHEAVGRNTTQNEVIEATIRLGPGPIQRMIKTQIQSQILRIAEN